MYLKQIELTGFKSFADKTVITPRQGISCIVGPNGSGKSNISDAVRWVLGEQSARNLRGGSISDVIFSGSKGRKALGMAEVLLTLDNSDGHLPLPHTEITVGRRNYRSGQSEYLINNQGCRLKDIHNLFMDSGVGLDGLSIISQGQISELISAKPDDRRVLIEEAAGIVKYRNRKKEALRKLDDTERNLERLQDIIGEIEERLEPLRMEAEDAKAYLELSEQADYYEINLSGLFLKELHGKLAEIKAELDGREQEILAIDTERLGKEAEALRKQEGIDGIDEALAEAQREYYALCNKKEQLSGSQQVLQTQIAHNEELKLQQTETAKALQEAQVKAEEQLAALQKELLELTAELAEATDAISAQSGSEQAQKEHLAYLEQGLSELKAAAFDTASLLAELRNKLHYQEQLAAQSTAKSERLATQQASIQAFYNEQQDKLDESEARALTLGEHKAALKVQRENAERRLQEHGRELTEIAAKETAIRFEYNSLESRYNTMKEMQDSMEGFYPGVRAVLKAARQGDEDLAGIIDAFASLITVPHEYSNAIETYLGGALQDIVCRSDAAAKAGIAHLKRIEGGRATFLPLDTLKPRRADAGEALRMAGILGFAADLVEYDKEIKPAVEFLLGRALVADDLEHASAAAKRINYRCCIITLDGDMINPGGSMTGGSRAKKSGDILSKKNNLDATLLRMQQLASQKEEWAAKLAAARAESEGINAELDRLNAEAAEINEQLSALIANKQSLAQAQSISSRQLAQIADELHEAALDAENIKAECAELNDSLAAATADEAKINSELAAKQAEYDELQQRYNAEHEDLGAYRIELARKQEALNALHKDIARAEQELTDTKWEIEHQQGSEQALSAESAKLTEGLQQLNGDMLALEHELAESEQALALKRHGLSAETEELRALEAEIKALLAASGEKQKALTALQIKVARMEADWDNEEQKLRERFNKDFRDMLELPPCELSKRELREKLNEHKRALSRLGNINLNAIEQYKEVSERYAFLTAQQQDLVTAKGTLHQVISEMDGIMVGRFKQAFNRLSEEFDIAFGRLFKGGNAALVLTEPEDMLATGVELEVHIPGKKVNNYNLLSGGEKSLIGLALMFAVLAVRPTPFCIMDEVDAALDEANVERFAAYLKDLACKTQFIMISHRQGTMEAAEALWGVTMQDSGISKLISVRLSDVERE